MRNDPNPQAQPVPDSNRNGNPSLASNSAGSASSSLLGEDQASLSGTPGQFEAVASEAAQFPEIRQERVNALRQSVLEGSYKPTSDQIAGSIFEHLAAPTPAKLASEERSFRPAASELGRQMTASARRILKAARLHAAVLSRAHIKLRVLGNMLAGSNVNYDPASGRDGTLQNPGAAGTGGESNAQHLASSSAG
jgi:flagellar biosynthesis anti-sigma factor FlgM